MPVAINDKRVRVVGVVAGAVIAFVAVLVWAWIDGGREPVHPITVEIPMPDRAG